MDAQAALRPAPPLRAPRLPARLLRLAADERLVELIRAGSAPAFEAAFDRHHRGILAFCRHMLGSADEAEDAVQHVFLAAYRALLAGDGRAINLRPWLYAIARNRCLSILRARRERPFADVPEPSTENLAEAVQRREDLRDMLRDVAGLPDDQRAALVLAELGDVSHEEIAEVLGVRREKVKALVFQARTSLAASRGAREVPCAEVREQLAELRGGALRRNTLRRHLRECAGCREFRAAMTSQRKALALLLPVVPTAGLKGAVLGSAFGGSAAAAGGAATSAGAGGGAASGSAAAGASSASVGVGGAASSFGGAGLVAKALVVVAVAGSGAAVGTRELSSHPVPAAHGAAPAARAHHEAVRDSAAAVAAPRRSHTTLGTGSTARSSAAAGSAASAIAHAKRARARGLEPAGTDGNHGRGDGSGGGRGQAPGQLAKPGGGVSPSGGGTMTAPGRLKTPGTSAAGGRAGPRTSGTGGAGHSNTGNSTTSRHSSNAGGNGNGAAHSNAGGNSTTQHISNAGGTGATHRSSGTHPTGVGQALGLVPAVTPAPVATPASQSHAPVADAAPGATHRGGPTAG